MKIDQKKLKSEIEETKKKIRLSEVILLLSTVITPLIIIMNDISVLEIRIIVFLYSIILFGTIMSASKLYYEKLNDNKIILNILNEVNNEHRRNPKHSNK